MAHIFIKKKTSCHTSEVTTRYFSATFSLLCFDWILHVCLSLLFLYYIIALSLHIYLFSLFFRNFSQTSSHIPHHCISHILVAMCIYLFCHTYIGIYFYYIKMLCRDNVLQYSRMCVLYISQDAMLFFHDFFCP